MLKNYTAWYCNDWEDDPVYKGQRFIFRRTFQAEDLEHAWEQALNACEEGETTLGVRPG